ncbi:MAG TPA: CdaR family protein [Thermoclostridium caenicola]|nr:CdaR family protein [Thermoclostridium caenicola]
MNRLIDKLFERDAVAKVLSVLIAILIWFLVLDQENPFTERTITVPLSSNVEVLEARNLQIVGSSIPATVDVRIRGRKKRVDSVSSADFSVFLDLSDVNNSGIQVIRVQPPEYTGDKDIIILGTNPATVRLYFEKIVGKQYPVNIEFTGNLPEGYQIVNQRVDPGIILIQEKEGTLSRIDRVVALVNLNDLSVTKELVVRVTVYDTEGKPMSQFEGKYPAIVSFDLARKLPVTTTVRGKPKAGYYFKEIIPDTSSVLVVGNKDLLDSISRIEAEAVDIEGKSESFRTELKLNVPQGATLADNNGTISVLVNIEPLATRTISFPTSQISIYDSDTSGAFEYAIAAHSISIPVEGRPELLQELDANDIRCSVSVRDLREGEHQVPVTVSLPAGISLRERPTVTVTINATAQETVTKPSTDATPVPTPGG